MRHRELEHLTAAVESAFETSTTEFRHRLKAQEVGAIEYVGGGIARVTGLPSVRSEELVEFPGRRFGLAFNLDRSDVGVILLDPSEELRAGAEVHPTGRVLDVPVGEVLLGRIVDALGRPLDERGPIRAVERRAVEQPAPGIMMRAPVDTPIDTGLKVVDALIPIGRGQRELIVGDRQTGKTAVAVDTIINQKDADVVCIYCAVGQRDASVASVISELREHDALAYSIIVVASGDDPPGQQFVAPYAAMSMAEHFMHAGRDVLVVYDDLTRHARAYRELSLLLRRPPGREAYPGDVFYIHSRLLERATHLSDEHGGGSITALPIVETHAQNISAYIPTNLISITDGQIYLSPVLFQKGILPAIDVGRSVSRVGGKAQLPAYRSISGELRLSYTQFQEMEAFARFGTRLDEDTKQMLRRGRRVREVLKQPQSELLTVPDQIAVLLAVTHGIFDDLDPESVGEAERVVRETFQREHADLVDAIQAGEAIESSQLDAVADTLRTAIDEWPAAVTEESAGADQPGKERAEPAERTGESERTEEPEAEAS